MTRKLIVPGDIDYDAAVGNPFGYLATLRSGSTKEQFDLDSINKSAHSGGGMEHVQNEVDIARTIREVVDSNMRVPRDMRIDDSGIPVAKNFYEWVTRDSFAMVNNEKPYIEQLCWGIISLNEACPKCSDLEYLYLDHNVADTYAKFARKVCLYENGVCPSCKKGRSYWIRKGKGRFIQELNVCAGQRCVVGAEVALTKDGLLRMSELAEGRPEGFSECDITIHNGIRQQAATKFFVAKSEPLLKATFHNGMTITGTKDHPVMTTAGFVKLSNLKEGDKVVSAIGQNMYGNGNAKSFTFHEETGVPIEVRTANREEVESYITILFSNWGRRTEFGYSVKAEGQFQKDVAAILMNMGVGVRLDDTHIHVSGIFLERLKEINHNNMYCDFEIPDCPVEEDWYDHLTTYNVMHLRTVKVEEAPAEITYDFHVPESHRFVCSGIVNHNSGKSLSVAGYFAPYLTHRMLKLQNPSAFYNLKTGTMLHCTFVALTYAQAKDTLWQNFYSTLVESAWFCIAEHTPITMHDGSKKAIEAVREGDQVATLEGVGDVVKHKYMGEKECFEVETEDGHILPGTSDHRVRCLSECGTKLVWKTIGELTEDDHVVVEQQNVSKLLSVTPVGVRKVYDFEVKDVHNYYAGGINVHNCEYHSMLRYYSDKFGEKLLRFNDTYVAYPARGLMAYPAGPDKRVLRGRTRYFAAIDEVGYFDSNKDSAKVKDNAHEIVGALDRSLLTMRGAAERLIKEGYDDVYSGYAMNVSSPSHRNDMICILVRKSQDSKSAYGVTRATWEVNPDLPRTSAAIEDAYRDNPQTAERDYGAVPPLASSPLISSEKQIEGVLTGRPNLLNIKRTVKRKQKLGESFTLAKIAKSKGFKKPTIMAIDAGYTNNSFSGVIGHVNEEEQAVVKALFEIIPARGAPLNHSLIFTDLLIPAMHKYNVRILLADRWNSIKLLQDAALEMDLAVAKQHSLKYPQLFNVKTRVQQGSLILPVPERGSLQECLTFEAADYPECFDMQPASHLAMQLATVKDTGRTVDKGDGYTDDIFRSLALFVWACDVEEFRMELDGSPDDEEVLERPTAFAVSGLLSGGGGQWGGGGSNTPSDGIGFVGGYLSNKR